MLNDILFFGSVLTFSAAAVLGHWQLLRFETGREELGVDADESQMVPEPVPVII